MANLIIKPTSGGSLVLQDEGGDAALTVGSTGTTTFAENASFASGKGMTLTSSSTFPTGHVLNVAISATTVGATTHASGTAYTTKDTAVSYTFVSANSKLFIIGDFNIAKSDNAGGWLAVQLARGGTQKMFIGFHGQDNEYSRHTTMAFDTGSHAVGDTWSYTVDMKRTGSLSAILNDADVGPKTQFTFFEMQL